MSVIDRLGSLVPSPTATEPDYPGPELDIDTALSLLANERRRMTIRYAIERAEGVFDLNDVARYIATHENGPDYTGSERKTVYISLYQTHVDKLVDAGVLERVDDAKAHTFRVDDAARPLYDVLEAATAQFGGEA